MKKIILLLFIPGVFFLYTGSIYSSAVKECKVKAQVLDIIPNNTDEPGTFLKIKVLKASFFEGHSAGKDCSYLDNMVTKIFLNAKQVAVKGGVKFIPLQFKKGEIVILVHSKVYNIINKTKKVYENWYVPPDKL